MRRQSLIVDEIWEYIGHVKHMESSYGNSDTCDMLVLDRMRSKIHFSICELLKTEFGLAIRDGLRITKKYFHALEDYYYDADLIAKLIFKVIKEESK